MAQILGSKLDLEEVNSPAPYHGASLLKSPQKDPVPTVEPDLYQPTCSTAY
jgi:hypothetical protein